MIGWRNGLSLGCDEGRIFFSNSSFLALFLPKKKTPHPKHFSVKYILGGDLLNKMKLFPLMEKALGADVTAFLTVNDCVKPLFRLDQRVTKHITFKDDGIK